MTRELPDRPSDGGANRVKWAALVVILLSAAAIGLAVSGALGGSDSGDSGDDGPGVAAAQGTASPPADGGGGAGAAPKAAGSIQVGEIPDGVAVGDGAVWAVTNGDGMLSRIDPATNTVTDTAETGVKPDSAVAGAGVVFVTSQTEGGKLLRFDVSSGVRLAASTDVGPKPEAMSLSEGILWVVISNANAIRQVDPRTGQPIGAMVPVGSEPIGIDVRDGRVWTANSGDGTVTMRRADGTLETVPVGRNPRDVVEAFGFVWVVLTDDDVVVRLDPATGDRVGPPITVGDAPHKIAAGEGALWVTNSKDGTVSQINPLTSEAVATIKVQSQPLGIATGDGAVWVGNHGSGTVTRIDPGASLAREANG